ncbi:LuxR C-terminal-related transcriptional regulator [Streptomyces sp. NPDC087908]|uniref:LuxR C-terminal-related transcriptional regulator n=1 Tax=Streptomyces sp. NPDC087908 TaxID=3365820 RepID=UPI003810EFB8
MYLASQHSAGVVPDPVPSLRKVSLVGRSAEIERITAVLSGGGLLISGPRGSGKTRLIEEAVHMVRGQSSGCVVSITASRLLQPYPLGALAAALSAAGLAAPKTPPEASAMLARLGRRKSLLLTVDDAHLLDGDSVALLIHLARQRACTVLLAAEAGLFETLTDVYDGGFDHLVLRPPEITQVAQIASRLFQRPVELTTLARFSTLAEGDLRLLHEMLQAALDSGSLVLDHGFWTERNDRWLTSPGLAPRRDSVLKNLTEEELKAMRLLSLAGRIPVTISDRVAAGEVWEGLERRGSVLVREISGIPQLVMAKLLLRHATAASIPWLQKRVLLEQLAVLKESASTSTLDHGERVLHKPTVPDGRARESVEDWCLLLREAAVDSRTLVAAHAGVRLAKLLFLAGRVQEAHAVFRSVGTYDELACRQARAGELLTALHLSDGEAVRTALSGLQSLEKSDDRCVDTAVALAAYEAREGSSTRAAATLEDAGWAALRAEAHREVVDIAHHLARIGHAKRGAALLDGEWVHGLGGSVLPALARFVTAVAAGRPEDVCESAEALEQARAPLYAAEAWAAAARLARVQHTKHRATTAMRRSAAMRCRYDGATTYLLHDAPEEAARLTHREKEIALLAAEGRSSREISEQLVLSVRTVDNHLHSTYRKLGVDSRRGLRTVLRSDQLV